MYPIVLPAAVVELAVRDSAPGCLSRDLKPGVGWKMHTGAVLISEVAPRLTAQQGSRRPQPWSNIAQVLDSVTVPCGWPSLPLGLATFDVFCADAVRQPHHPLFGSDDFPIEARQQAAIDLTEAARTGDLTIPIADPLPLEQTPMLMRRSTAEADSGFSSPSPNNKQSLHRTHSPKD